MVLVQQFLNYINENKLHLKFTGTWSKESVAFLDLTRRGDTKICKVITSLYRKPLAGNTILRANSCHHKYTITVPRGEYIRVKGACSKTHGMSVK